MYVPIWSPVGHRMRSPGGPLGELHGRPMGLDDGPHGEPHGLPMGCSIDTCVGILSFCSHAVPTGVPFCSRDAS